MQRYFATIESQVVKLSQADVFHLTRVMRARPGDYFEVVDDVHQLYLAKVDTLNPFTATVLEKKHEERELPVSLSLYYVMAKGDRTDLVIQKAVELGVHHITLLQSRRSVVKIDASNVKKRQRYEKIAKEAAEQSKRLIIPSIDLKEDFNDALSQKADFKLIAYEADSGKTTQLYALLDKVKTTSSIVLLVGPEGGFDPEEVENAENKGFVRVGLGKRILRSETAAIHFVGVVASYLEKQ